MILFAEYLGFLIKNFGRQHLELVGHLLTRFGQQG